MKRLQQIEVTETVSYKHALLDISQEGLYVIHGRNLDRPEKNSSNGAGKSLIVSILPDLRYGAPPSPLKAKKSWKDNYKKGTKQSIVVIDEHDNNYKISRSASEMQVIKNNKDLKIRGKAGVEAELQKLIPLNEEQFYSFVYLDTKQPSILQYGTDVQRHAFIEKMYKLDVYDQLGVLIKKDWEKTQRLVQDLEVLDKQLSEKTHSVKGDPKELKNKYRDLLNKTEEFRQKVSDLLAERQQCRTFITLAEDLDLSVSLETLKTELLNLRQHIKALREKYNNAIENNKKHEAFEALRETRNRLEQEFKQYKDVVIDKSIPEKIKADKELLNKIELCIEENKDIEARIATIKKYIDLNKLFKANLKGSLKKQALAYGSEKLNKQLNKERILLRELNANLTDTEQHFNDHDDQACPICSTALDKQTMKDIIKVKQTRIKKIGSKIVTLQEMIAYAEKTENLEASQKELEEEKKSLHKNIEDTKNIEERIAVNENKLGLMRKKVLCKSKLKELPELEDVEVKDIKPIQEKINDLAECIEQHTKFVEARQNLLKLELPFDNVKQAKKQQKKIETSLSEYQPMLEKIQDKLNRVSIDATRAETLVQEINKLSEQINELKLQTSNHKITTALRKAFGARGIRKQRVAEIGVALEATFNDYATQIFDSPIRFELIISDTKFQILAHRNGGVSDVRRLSGAESRYFTILTMLTLLKFCPNEMRIDTVVLDEIEANLDTPFKRRYVDVCLPKILELVPKVIVVTPQSEKELFIPKAHVYTVEKKGNVSILHRR